MKLVFFLFSLATAGIGAEVTAHYSAVYSSLGLPIPILFDVLPFGAAAGSFLILAFHSRGEENDRLWQFVKGNRILERLILAAAVAFAASRGLGLLAGRNVARTWMLPVTIAAIALFILTIRASKQDLSAVIRSARKARLPQRFTLVAVLLGTAWASSLFYFKREVTELPCPEWLLQESDWRNLQAALPFRVVRVSSLQGPTVCFVRAPGRTQQVRSLLLRPRGAPANPRKSRGTDDATRRFPSPIEARA